MLVKPLNSPLLCSSVEMTKLFKSFGDAPLVSFAKKLNADLKATEARSKPLPWESLARKALDATPWRPTTQGKEVPLWEMLHISQ